MPTPFLSSEEYDERAHQLYNDGQYEEALTVLREGLALYPNAVELHVGVGYARLAREEYAWARRAFEEALQERLGERGGPGSLPHEKAAERCQRPRLTVLGFGRLFNLLNHELRLSAGRADHDRVSGAFPEERGPHQRLRRDRAMQRVRLLRADEREAALQQLEQEPEAEEEKGGQLADKDDPEEDEEHDAGAREQQQIGAEHAGNGAARADHRDLRAGVRQHLGEDGGDAAHRDRAQSSLRAGLRRPD
jgi:hypothetical protein